jgi:hypothetical protein
LILSLFNLALSITLYISFLILVPVLEFSVGSTSINYQFSAIIIFLIFTWLAKNHYSYIFDNAILKPFMFLYLSLLLLSLSTSYTPLQFQITKWISAIVKTCIPAYILWNVCRLDRKALVYLTYGLIASLTIANIYGIFLSLHDGSNPYTSYLSQQFGEMDSATIYSMLPARLSFLPAAKIQSTMMHPVTWALVLCFSLVFLVSLYIKEKKKYYLILIVMSFVNLVISGVRTGLIALLFTFLIAILMARDINKICLVIVITICSLGFIIFNTNDNMLGNVLAFTSFSEMRDTDMMQGSSPLMRLRQFNGALHEISGCLFNGKGFAWNRYYTSIRGNHPILIAFESLLFVIIVNSGMFGIFVWLVFILLLFQLPRKILNRKQDILLIDSLINMYLIFSIGTGEYGNIQYFAIFYAYLLCFMLNNKLTVNSQKEI